MCVCVCVCACKGTYCCYYMILRVKHFYTSRELCKMLTGYLSLECLSGGDLQNALTLDKAF